MKLQLHVKSSAENVSQQRLSCCMACGRLYKSYTTQGAKDFILEMAENSFEKCRKKTTKIFFLNKENGSQ